jgi:hypothetical protein
MTYEDFIPLQIIAHTNSNLFNSHSGDYLLIFLHQPPQHINDHRYGEKDYTQQG